MLPPIKRPRENTLKVDIVEYAHSAAAIMHEWMYDRESYNEFYEKRSNQFAGFVGIQYIAARAAVIFTDEASEYIAGEDFYWIEAIEYFAQEVLQHLSSGKEPSNADLQRLAAASIEKCKIR